MGGAVAWREFVFRKVVAVMSGFEQIKAGAPAGGRVPGPTVSVEEAAQALGIGRTLAYRLAAAGELPVPVIRVGRKLRVPAAPLRALLGLAPEA